MSQHCRACGALNRSGAARCSFCASALPAPHRSVDRELERALLKGVLQFLAALLMLAAFGAALWSLYGPRP